MASYASDPDGDLVGVEYYVNGKAVGQPKERLKFPDAPQLQDGERITITDENGTAWEFMFYSDASSLAGVLDATAVESLYQKLLGRVADADGLTYWSTLGVSYSVLANALYEGPEFRNRAKTSGEAIQVPIGATATETRDYLVTAINAAGLSGVSAVADAVDETAILLAMNNGSLGALNVKQQSVFTKDMDTIGVARIDR